MKNQKAFASAASAAASTDAAATVAAGVASAAASAAAVVGVFHVFFSGGHSPSVHFRIYREPCSNRFQ